MDGCRGAQDQPWRGRAILHPGTYPISEVCGPPWTRTPVPCLPQPVAPSAPASRWSVWNQDSLQGYFCLSHPCDEDSHYATKALSSAVLSKTQGRCVTSLLQALLSRITGTVFTTEPLTEECYWQHPTV